LSVGNKSAHQAKNYKTVNIFHIFKILPNLTN